MGSETAFDQYGALTLFLALLTAHLIADFQLQPTPLVDQKSERPSRIWAITKHIAIVSAVLLPFVWPADHSAAAWRTTGEIIAITAVAHFLTDWAKEVWLDRFRKSAIPLGEAKLNQKRTTAFIVDQIAHITLVGGLAIAYAGHASPALLNELPLPDGLFTEAQYFQALTLVSAFIAGVSAGGYLISLATDSLAPEAGGDTARQKEGLKGGGKVIGWLERSLVIGLMLAGQIGAIGFIIAAKSVLRFGDIGPRADKSTANRHDVEYVIIGTFMSFGWALLIGAGAGAVLCALSPCPPPA